MPRVIYFTNNMMLIDWRRVGKCCFTTFPSFAEFCHLKVNFQVTRFCKWQIDAADCISLRLQSIRDYWCAFVDQNKERILWVLWVLWESKNEVEDILSLLLSSFPMYGSLGWVIICNRRSQWLRGGGTARNAWWWDWGTNGSSDGGHGRCSRWRRDHRWCLLPGMSWGHEGGG